MGLIWNECHPPLRTWIEFVVQSQLAALESQHVGTYLHGSLAQGSFYPPKSDVDLLVVVRNTMDQNRRAKFIALCQELSARRPILGDLECTVITTEFARTPRHPSPIEARYAEGTTTEELMAVRESPDVATYLRTIRESGIVLAGELIDNIIGHVDDALFIRSVAEDHDWILDDEHLCESPVYGTLNLCRALWVWRGASERLAPSKEEAGLWAMTQLPPHLVETVRRALAAYRDAAWIEPTLRRTAGRSWNRDELLAFRDHFAALRIQLGKS